MSMSTITIEVDEETRRRLERVSLTAGVSMGDFARDVLLSCLEDIEDAAEAEAALKEAETEGLIPWEQIKESHGL